MKLHKKLNLPHSPIENSDNLKDLQIKALTDVMIHDKTSPFPPENHSSYLHLSPNPLNGNTLY